MKRYLIILSALLFLVSCSKPAKQDTAIVVNGIDISANEFQQAYQASIYSAMGTVDKKDFLDTFISRKLILLKAEDMGLDKDPEFLSDIQNFWEQSLLKRVLAKEKDELIKGIEVSEKDMQDFYNAHKNDAYLNQPYSAVKKQIRSLLLMEKQQAAISGWIESLKKNASIKIDYKKLGIPADK